MQEDGQVKKRMSNNSSEIAVGILYYGSKSDGIGGVIKADSDDFIVDEIPINLPIREDGRYLLIKLEKINWDTHHLIKELARRLMISQRRLSFAGTKDKRARSTQLISIEGISWDDLNKVILKDATFHLLGYSDRRLGMGDLIGNRFTVTVSQIPFSPEKVERNLTTIRQEVDSLGGIPNFYGLQRFGSTRPITHLIGKKLVEGNVEGAIMHYIAMPFEGEMDNTREVREFLWEAYLDGSHESVLGEALQRFPKHLSYERSLLSVLISKGDPVRAISAIPFNLQRMFVHAYQSYLFNLMLSHRLMLDLPLNEPIEGECIMFIDENGIPSEKSYERFTQQKASQLLRLIKAFRAVVGVDVVGYKTSPLQLPEYARSVLDEQGVELSKFKLELPKPLDKLSAKGSVRALSIKVNQTYHVLEDKSGGSRVTFRFDLPRGTYATSLLREYTKAESYESLKSKVHVNLYEDSR
ncbi:MAG: tRNA pseudouridine(13) synthase TruD [Methermicoccaceae archaeon]